MPLDRVDSVPLEVSLAISLLALLEVLFGTLWAWLGAGETPTTATLLGGAVVLGALVFNELAGRRTAALA